MNSEFDSPPECKCRRHAWSIAVFFVLLVVASSLAAWKVNVAIDVGAGWDTYAFLANAAEFAGKGYGYSEPHRPPLISLITSLWFRIAPLTAAPIQWIDGALTVSGVLALYLLFKRRVNVVLAFGGAMAFLGVAPLWDYLGVGYTDTAAIAVSAWALLATVAATERHPAFYLIAGPLFTAAVMMRYTALLFAFPLAVWLLLRWRPILHARYLAGGVALAAATYIPFGLRYAAQFDDAMFPFLFAFALSETVTAPGGEGAASAQAGYYLEKLPGLIGPQSVAWLGTALMISSACVLFGVAIQWLRKNRTQWVRTAAALSLAGLLLAGTQTNLGLAGRQVGIMLAVLIVWRTISTARVEPGPSRVNPVSALDATMLAWFLAYLDFHGHQTLQVPRYLITMAPGLLYFTLLGWQMLITHVGAALGEAVPRRKHASTIAILTLSLTLAVPLVYAPFSQALATPSERDRFVYAARDSAKWLTQLDSDVRGKTIYSDLWPLTAWYLQTEAKPMPFFHKTEAFAHELEKSRAHYFVTLRGRRFPPYQEIYSTGPVTVLARTNQSTRSLPRVAYLGKSWDNYIEQLTGYSFYLDSTAGRYGFEGSAFLDAYDPLELSSFDAVAVAGVRWRDRGAGENALREYVVSGGSLIIDASQNLGGMAHSAADTIMFDTMIRRGALPGNAPIAVDDAFATRNPRIGPVVSSAWVDESGGTWSGAYYEPRPGTPPLETLATVGGRPLVQLQRLGQGRIYWIAFNLPWHAYLYENPSEARLMQAVFDEAIAATKEPRRPVDELGF